MNQGFRKIAVGNKILAIVVRKSFKAAGLSFVTPEDFPFQLGLHISKAGTHVRAHGHKPFSVLKNVYPQEFFYVENGKVEITLYYKRHRHSKVILNDGDMIILNCAHEVKFLKDSKFIELKQGPYRGKDAEKEYL